MEVCLQESAYGCGLLMWLTELMDKWSGSHRKMLEAAHTTIAQSVAVTVLRIEMRTSGAQCSSGCSVCGCFVVEQLARVKVRQAGWIK